MGIESPTPEQVQAARQLTGMTQEETGKRFGYSARGWRHKEATDGRKLTSGEYELLLLLAGMHPDYELMPKKKETDDDKTLLPAR